MDVAVWLRDLGLEQYEALFRENDIDAEVLSDLTDGDLENIGVSLGHRKRLLKAIAALALATHPRLRPLSLLFPATPLPTPPSAASSRSCSAISSARPRCRRGSIPRTCARSSAPIRTPVRGAVARYDGFVAKFMGDGVLAYFGFPRAHEDDAERAVRAGLDIAAAVASCDTRANETLKVRIGIATGLVVVGESHRAGLGAGAGVVGETPNLAARLQALAEPGSVVIAESTRRLLGGAFELKALGPQTLKGFDAPVPAWTVVREAENVSRFEASRSEAMTPFVGREHEVALLIDRWRDASEGEGQVVLLSGEAGIGKSRILAALRERIGDERACRGCAINARRTTSTTPSIRSSAKSGMRRVSSAASRRRRGSTSWRR